MKELGSRCGEEGRRQSSEMTKSPWFIPEPEVADIGQLFITEEETKYITTPGIYFLYNNNGIVYIGSTPKGHLRDRIYYHKQRFDFNIIGFIKEEDAEECHEFEQLLIEIVRPPYNVMRNTKYTKMKTRKLPGRPFALTQEQVDIAFAKRERGETLESIGLYFGVSHSTISRVLKQRKRVMRRL